MTPEQKARQKIDQQLQQCGWIVQSIADLDISAGMGVAVREFQLTTGAADYLLYVDAKVIGVIEAKPEGFPLTGVETQSAKYTEGLPPALPKYRLPLPFAYESTGTQTQFTNALEPDARSRLVFSFHRPEELLRLVKLNHQTRALLRQLPPLDETGLWPVQAESIHHLEKSQGMPVLYRQGKPNGTGASFGFTDHHVKEEMEEKQRNQDNRPFSFAHLTAAAYFAISFRIFPDNPRSTCGQAIPSQRGQPAVIVGSVHGPLARGSRVCRAFLSAGG